MPWHSTVGWNQKAVREYQDGLFDVIEFLIQLAQESEARCGSKKCGKKSWKD